MMSAASQFALGTYLAAMSLYDRCPACGSVQAWHSETFADGSAQWWICKACRLVVNHEGRIRSSPVVG